MQALCSFTLCPFACTSSCVSSSYLRQDNQTEGSEEDADDSSKHSGAALAKRRLLRNGRHPAQKLPNLRCVDETGAEPVSTRGLGPDGRTASNARRRIKRKQQQTAEAPPGVEDNEVEVEDEDGEDDDADFTAPARRSSGRGRAADSVPGSPKEQRALSSSAEQSVSDEERSKQGSGLDEDGTPASDEDSEPSDAEDLVRYGVTAEQPPSSTHQR